VQPAFVGLVNPDLRPSDDATLVLTEPVDLHLRLRIVFCLCVSARACEAKPPDLLPAVADPPVVEARVDTVHYTCVFTGAIYANDSASPGSALFRSWPMSALRNSIESNCC
jgi:hypothetical protein